MIRFRTGRVALTLLLLALSRGGVAQLAPSGYTGAFNTPTADVLTPGDIAYGVSNTIPEIPRVYGTGYFGSMDLGLGVLPGLEVVPRLTYDGDPSCNQFFPGCQSTTRDLSANAKYQLPIELPWNSHVAAGVTDFGGAASHYRQEYGVVTSTFGPLDITGGLARSLLPTSMMKGFFGSLDAHLDEHFSILAEDDSRAPRLGGTVHYPLGQALQVDFSLSHKVGNRNPNEQASQATLTLTYNYDRPVAKANTSADATPWAFTSPVTASQVAPRLEPVLPEALRRTTPPPEVPVPPVAPPPRLEPVLPGALQRTTPPSEVPVAPVAPDAREQARRFAESFSRHGFGDISVARLNDHSWWVKAEPVRWRKNRLEALGAAFRAWLALHPKPGDHFIVTLTYLQNPVLTAQTSQDCLAVFKRGWDICGGEPAIRLSSSALLPREHAEWLVDAYEPSRFKPQLEFGPGLNYKVGTEPGLFNYALALESGWEIPLAQGALWQGYYSSPVSHSERFDPGQPFGNELTGNQIGQDMLSYEYPLPLGIWAQASGGYINGTDPGGQLDMLWMSPEGRFRLSGVAGSYVDSFQQRHTPLLATGRVSLIPGRWETELAGGEFYNKDRGLRFASLHWFGNTRLALYLQGSGTPDRIAMPFTKTAGFLVSFGLGPQESTDLGPVSVRGRDLFSLGLESKVGGTNNNITAGYGIAPELRHGITSDLTDYDRSGLQDMWANLYMLRAALKENEQ